MRLIVVGLLLIACLSLAVLASPRVDGLCLTQRLLHTGDPTYRQWHCLHYAAARDDAGASKRLLDQGTDIDVRNAAGRTPLAEAATRGHWQTVRALLRRGAQVEVYDTESGFTPLHLAAENNHPAVVRRLLAAGAPVDARNQWGQTPLWQASWQAWHGNTEVAHILVAQGASIDSADHQGHTPLHMAARAGHTGMVEFLLEAGADSEHRSNQDRTPLHQAVIGDHADAALVLLAHGADPNAASGEAGMLELARRDASGRMVDLLHEHGAVAGREDGTARRLRAGRGHLRSGRLPAAIAAFEAVISLRPKDARGYYYRGLARHRAGDHQRAAADLERAMTLDPTHTSALERLSQVYADLGQEQRAAALLERLVAAQPDYGRAHFLLANRLHGLGNTQGAIDGRVKACQLGYRPACAD